jgi:flagellar assembly protein FliH
MLSESGVRVVPEPGLAAADAVVEVDGQVLDLRLRSALDRVREVLS